MATKSKKPAAAAKSSKKAPVKVAKKPAVKTGSAKKSVPAKSKKPVAVATKKNVIKKTPAKPAKSAKPASVKAKAQPAQKSSKPTAKAKPVAKKAVPAKKATPAKKVAKPVAKAKPAAKALVKAPASAKAPAKPLPKKATPVKPAAKPVANKPATPAKPAAAAKVTASAKPAPVAPAPAPVKKSKQPVIKKPSLPKSIPMGRPIPSNLRPIGKPGQPVKPTAKVSVPLTARRAVKDDKKPTLIVPHRKVESKESQLDQTGKKMINYQPEFMRSILDQPDQPQGPVYRYSDEELGEFRAIINQRLDAARKELGYLQGLITRKDEAGTEDTENRYMNMEDGSGAMEREQLAQMASRQIQFISHLEKALMRIENKTYGICRITGNLIDKARLRAVPHATLSIEAKKLMAGK